MQADNTSTIFNKFEVALLIEDIHEAKEVSDALRNMGIYAHYYSNLDEFWVAANAQTPDFLLVDVKRMSQGNLLFKNHSKVKNGTLKFGFFYTKSSKILVNSTFGLGHYGLVTSELDLTGQLRSMLEKLASEVENDLEKKKLQERVQRLQTRANKVMEDAGKSFKFQNQFSKMMEVSSRLGTPKTQDEFVNNLMSLMSEWEACERYGIYTLNSSDQKLVSPKFIKPNYEKLPELWLTRPGDKGIEEYAVDMACEVAFDLFDHEARAIFVRGIRNNPEIILIAKFNEEEMNGFAWDLFEERLSHRLSILMHKSNNASQVTKRQMSAWEAFNYLDDMHFHQANTEHRLVDVNLSNLVNKIKEKNSNRFYWKSFCADFINEVESCLSGDFRLSMYGAERLMVFMDKRYIEEGYQRLKAVTGDFQFWRYFQDTSSVMTTAMRPEVNILAPSSVNYLRQANTEVVSAPVSTHLKRAVRGKRERVLDA